MGEKKNEISIEYLVDLLSSIKSALSNIDSNEEDVKKLVSDLTESFTVLSELSKRQYQDEKELISKLDNIVSALQELNISNKIMHQDLGNRLDGIIEVLSMHLDQQMKKKENLQANNTNTVEDKKEIAIVRWTRNMQAVFNNLDGTGKAIVGLIVSILAIASIVFKFM